MKASRSMFALTLGLGVALTMLSVAQAGDILRGGSPMSSTASGASYGTSAATTLQARTNAQDALARTTQAIKSVQAMQAAAHNLARSGANNLGLDPNHPGQALPNVPNGLVIGGLVPDSGLASPGVAKATASWQNALTPVQSALKGQTTIVVKQTAQQALLNWQTFNLGKETSLHFDQRAGGSEQSQWIAFNKINDPSGVPSQILGSMSAEGQVYLINQNGILFGGTAQINLHSLTASSLPINDNLVSRGLLNNPDNQFLFSSLAIPVLANGGTMPAFTPPPKPNTPSGRIGDVTVQAGATIIAPTTADHVGGRVALIGPNVQNAGVISTPDGQTILAAGQQVGFLAHPSADPSLRGLDVYVGSVDANSGTATNSGLINASRANVTMVGQNVNQLGDIQSTTSVSLNSRIDLLANYNTVRTIAQGSLVFSPSADGVVTMGQGSVTQILPELASTDRVIGTQLALPSQINLQGKAVHLAGDSLLLAPNANLSINAGEWLSTGGGYAFTYTNGQIYLDSGANINVAGSTDIAAPISENIVSAQLRGAELADSPLQRFGALRGQTIQIDIRQTGTYQGQTWVGTPLADASGYVGLIQRTVGELTTAGGTVKLNAGNSVVLQSGATINVSGGWTNYQGGLVETTRVLSQGRIYDIAQATPDVMYDGIYEGTFTTTRPKWGITDTYSHPLLSGAHYEAGYTFGANGGSIAIKAPSLALDGQLLGNTVAGPRQRTIAPTPSAFSLNFEGQDPDPNHFPIFLPYSPTPPKILFAPTASQSPIPSFALDATGNPLPLSASRQNLVVLSPDLTSADGFGSFQIINTGENRATNNYGSITVPANVTLQSQSGGSISFVAANIDIEGKLIAPGGSLSLTTYNLSPYDLTVLQNTPGAQTPDSDANSGHFILGPSAVLTTTGLVVDDRPSSSTALTLPLETKGGAITINSYTANLLAGSLLDVSGGVAVNATGKTSYGRGGTLSIKAGQDPTLPSLLGGKLTLNSNLAGYSGSQGGSLSLQAPLVQIGGEAVHALTLLLSSDFFSQGGFSSFAINGLGLATDEPDHYLPALTVAPQTQIMAVQHSMIAQNLTNGSNLTLTSTLMPVGLRTPVSLSLTASGVRDPFKTSPGDLVARGELVIGTGATIQTDPRGSVALRGDTITVLGSINAPSGTITISGGKSYFSLLSSATALPTVDLGPASRLSTAGVILLTPDPRNYRTGIVLPGGTISVSGNIVAQSGAMLNVSGANGILDLPIIYTDSSAVASGSLSGALVVPVKVDSNGGSILLSGTQELFSDATLMGAAGGPTATGGTLSVSSGRFYAPGDNPPTPLDVTLIVTQSGPTLPRSLTSSGQAVIGHPVMDENGNVLSSFGYFAADSFKRSGFDALILKGTVEFSGSVNLAARGNLAVADGGVIIANPDAQTDIHLSAPYVRLGTAFLPPLAPQQQLTSAFIVAGQPFYFNPTYGPASLTVSANLIDVGNLSLQNIGKLSLLADQGDIRGDGTLDVAGEIFLRAGQIYPPTALGFTIAAYDYLMNGTTHSGAVTVAASGSRMLPLSAGGQLNIYGSIIKQGGVLRAPLGSINLGWDGTGSEPRDIITGQAVPSTQQLTLATGSTTSVSAVDPATGQSLTIPYGLNANGTSWIDPTGTDITISGAPVKAIVLSAAAIDQQKGAAIDIRGGGDLSAYRFISGLSGTQDILASSSSFAIVPNYQADFAPYAPFNTKPLTTNLGSDPGYVNTGLQVGDQVFLGASPGLTAGSYTLLPARYALLSGAFLITPQSGSPGTIGLPDGASLVSGYRFNNLSAARSGRPLLSSFEVAPASVLHARAEYDLFSANNFLSRSTSSRLPVDAGRLVLKATQAMNLQGTLSAQAPLGGRGGLVDISSPVDILIAGSKTITSGFNGLILNSSELGKFGAASLLIGGTRSTGADGTQVSVATNNLIVNNAGSPLSGADIILVANQTLTLAPNSSLKQSGGSASPVETLLFGNAALQGSGDGVLLRVSHDSSASIIRNGVSSSTQPAMTIGAGSSISGTSLILDSTYATILDPSTKLSDKTITIDSGQISLQLTSPGPLQPTAGLVLSGDALQSLQNSAQALSLLSYSSIDIYGTGEIGSTTFASLALHTAEIRGFHNDGGAVSFTAQNILLDNSPDGIVPGLVVLSNGTLGFNANVITLGQHTIQVDQYADLSLNAAGGILAQATGSFVTQGTLTLITPLLTGAKGASQTITAGGALSLQTPAEGVVAQITGGLGASLSLTGASITDDTDIVLPSGLLTLHATSGDLVIGNNSPSRLDVSGQAQSFFDLVKYTDGGQIRLIADLGSVNIVSGSMLTVSAPAGGGNAGRVSVIAPTSEFSIEGQMFGVGGLNGLSGSLSLDVGKLPAGLLSSISPALLGFEEARSIRDRLDSLVTIDGLRKTHDFDLSADAGSILVTGVVDASGATGGTITLTAHNNLTLLQQSVLTVAAVDFDAAGKGGSISLEAGAETNGIFANEPVGVGPQLDIQNGALLDLSVAVASQPGSGKISGTLQLRAPQINSHDDVQIQKINGTIQGSSSIVVEGYQVFDASADGTVDSQEAAVLANGLTFGGNSSAMVARLLGNSVLSSVVHIRPGAEIITTQGDLTLVNDWDLANSPLGAFRFGPGQEPGNLTLRASGNLIFTGALMDGFGPAPTDQVTFSPALWEASLLPAGSTSWSYHLIAGADFSAADASSVQSLSNLANGAGSLLLGKDGGTAISNVGTEAVTAGVVNGLYQVIRTGTGDIEVSAGRDVQLLNQFATIYTAGSQVTPGGSFDLPKPNAVGGETNLGATQETPPYPAQYSLGGGNVTITAQNDIIHLTRDINGQVIADSERELPNNWLYRRGYVNSLGQFGTSRFGETASTSWWIDFSNFFEGVGALGGGDVTMTAGRDVSNVDAVAPTNAYLPKGTPDASQLIELGGGNLMVRADRDVNGGVYYVERGQGTISAGGSIHTNSTRSPSLTIISGFATDIYPTETWLPTTLFAGQSSFNVSARGDLLLGPVANSFLLPQGLSNSFWYKTYYSTYAPSDAVNLISLSGSVTLRESATLPSDIVATPLLAAWLKNIDQFKVDDASTVSFFQPWLRLVETNVDPFANLVSLSPATLRATAFAGDINLVGNLTLSPSASGTVDLTAYGSINALQIYGVTTINGVETKAWGSSTINLSDADPAALPGITSPLAYQAQVGTNRAAASRTSASFFTPFSRFFNESGSTQDAVGYLGTKQSYGVLQTKQALHAPGVLHAHDAEPVRLYANAGDISGLTLFSGKTARVVAGRDLTDIALYLQNDAVGDVSLVTSGRDLVAYDANSPLRSAATALGNILNFGSATLAGDIQVSGPGTLEVTAGRNLDLGTGANNSDGTGVGLTSIGNARNPYLPFAGADIIAAAGLGSAVGVENSRLNFKEFITQFVNGPEGARYLSELGDIATTLSISDGASFNKLPVEMQDRLALDLFYLVLRDAGRDHSLPATAGFGNYTAGINAVTTLFPGTWKGDITTQSRDIRTKSGGNISLFAPGGSLTLETNVTGPSEAPPGVITEDGGNISIFTNQDVNIGISRIFTLRGGNEIIWSSLGNIAAGSSSKTVQSAPPTRVLIDPQSGDVKTDLAGLATGGGIGVLTTVIGVPPGNVDLIAPVGTVDAGDAGIRVSGNLNIAAAVVLNASNIQAGGASVGVPTTTVAAPNLGALTSASNTAGAGQAAATDQAASQRQQQNAPEETPSIITVEVVGYGGA